MTKKSTIIFMPCDYDDLTEITSLSESVLEQSYEDEDLNDELVGTLSEMSDKELSIMSDDENLDEYSTEKEQRLNYIFNTTIRINSIELIRIMLIFFKYFFM